jgi:hypothetical protein
LFAGNIDIVEDVCANKAGEKNNQKIIRYSGNALWVLIVILNFLLNVALQI